MKFCDQSSCLSGYILLRSVSSKRKKWKNQMHYLRKKRIVTLTFNFAIGTFPKDICSLNPKIRFFLSEPAESNCYTAMWIYFKKSFFWYIFGEYYESLLSYMWNYLAFMISMEALKTFKKGGCLNPSVE